MAAKQLNSVLGCLRRVAGKNGAGKIPDRQLLERFVAQRDDNAFATLVARHGPLVLDVCRRLLSDPSAVDDAFQATFLVLVHKANRIRRSDLLGNWLYGVAFRTATRAKAEIAKRRARERAAPVRQPSDPLAEITARELLTVLDEELHRLPTHLRAPLVLCYLQSLTHDEAARQCGWSLATLDRRLGRGRTLLRARLAARGLTFPSTLVVVGLCQASVSAAVPPSLAIATVRAATQMVSSDAATSAVSAEIAALTKGVLKAMLLAKLKIATAVLALSIIGFGASLFTYRALAGEKTSTSVEQGKTEPAKKQPPPQTKPKTDKDRLQGTWIVHSAEAGGAAAPDSVKSLKLVFVGDKVTFHFTEDGTGSVKEGTYALASKKNPKEIDFTCDNKTQEAIYTFDKDQLKLALAEIGQDRPTKFESLAGTRQLLIVFKRHKEESQSPTVTDAEKLQGIWTGRVLELAGRPPVAPGEKDESAWKVRVLINGRDLTLRGPTFHFYVGFGVPVDNKFEFRLDEKNSPKLLDLTIPKGPEDIAAASCLGIYSLEGDTLKICLSTVNKQRPAEFKTSHRAPQILVELRRDLKATWEDLPKLQAVPPPQK